MIELSMSNMDQPQDSVDLSILKEALEKVLSNPDIDSELLGTLEESESDLELSEEELWVSQV